MFTNRHLHLTKPNQHISVLLKSGLTNFSEQLVKAKPLTLKEKFSAGVFCFFLTSKRKKPVWPGQKNSNPKISSLLSQ